MLTGQGMKYLTKKSMLQALFDDFISPVTASIFLAQIIEHSIPTKKTESAFIHMATKTTDHIKNAAKIRFCL
jgi:hypothetical protein